jgi:uncharacterized cupredoxin-like copper-binding protein
MGIRTTRFLAGLFLLGLSACGGKTDTSGGQPAHVVAIEMRDIAFSPSAVTVPRGQKVRFVFSNKGKVTHDAFVGTERAQTAHEKEMRDGSGESMGGMHHGGHSGEGVTVEPGKTGELEVTFAEAEPTLIGCHQPDHYAAGMKVAVTVS